MTDYDKLRQLAQAATPGPWYMSNWGEGTGSVKGPSGSHLFTADGGWVTAEANLTDAEFIAAANPAVVLALLDGLRDAWDQGYTAGSADTHNDGLYGYTDNPYGEPQ